MNKRIKKFFVCGLMIFNDSSSGFINNSLGGYCIHLYCAIIVKFYFAMYIQQNKCIKAIL